ncbi:MAG: ABC-three component system protein [Solirubrobacteraceae bacterium]
MAESSHLAAGPALGYIYQFQVALLQLVPHALTNADVEVSLEVFDDVAFDFNAGPARSVFQVHHSLTSERELLDTSAKLWKTLAIWASEWNRLEPGESRLMTLLSTQRARAGTGLAALTLGNHAPEQALPTLVAVAEDPNGANGTAKDRAVFLTLGEVEQREMLRNVVVIDGAPPAVDMHERLQELLAPTHESRYVASMADAIEGWWWPQVALALTSGGSVHAADLRAAIDDARRSLSSTALPILRLEDFSAAELPSLDPAEARFLQCLYAIAASAARRTRAVDDYQRAFAHRSRWARRGLLGPREYERYEDDLHGQWVIACDRMLRTLSADADPKARTTAGHDLWDTMEADVRQPLRPGTSDGFIQRGSLHQLAEDQRLAWHPDAAGELYCALNQEEATA